MIRTQIYLTKELHQEIKLVARKEKKAQSEIIRDALKKGLRGKEPKKSLAEELLEIAKLAIPGGPKDLSTNHDDYLYGDKK